MIRHSCLSCFVLIVSVSVSYAKTNSKIRTFHYSRSLEDCQGVFYSSANVLGQTSTKSLTQCGLLCARSSSGCVSFNFRSTTSKISAAVSNCQLLSSRAVSCKEMIPKLDWAYYTLNEPEDTVPPDNIPTITCPSSWCSPDSCSSWTEIYEFNPSGDRGSKGCLIQAMKNGALFRTIMTLHDGLTFISGPVEATFEMVNSIAYFFFGPIYIAGKTASEGRKIFVRFSTDHQYNMDVYSLSHDSIATVDSLPLEAKMFVRLADCNENGQPIIFTAPENSAPPANDESGAKLIQINDRGAVLRLYLQENNVTRSLYGDWSIHDNFYGHHRLAVAHLKGQSLTYSAVANSVPALSTSDYSIHGMDGSITTLNYEEQNGNVRIKQKTSDRTSWFSDSCWSEVYKVDKTGVGSHDYPLSRLTRSLGTGSAIRIQFHVGNTMYATRVPKVSCSGSSCVATLSNHPKFNPMNPLKFSVNGTTGYRLFGSYLDGSKWTSYRLNTPVVFEVTDVDVSWLAHSMSYRRTFNAVADQDNVLNDVKSYVGIAANFRLVFVDELNMGHFYDIEHILQHDNGTTEFYTAHVTEAYTTASPCRSDVTTTEMVMVVSSGSFSLRYTTWTWDYQTVCAYNVQQSFREVSLFASHADIVDEGEIILTQTG